MKVYLKQKKMVFHQTKYAKFAKINMVEKLIKDIYGDITNI